MITTYLIIWLTTFVMCCITDKFVDKNKFTLEDAISWIVLSVIPIVNLVLIYLIIKYWIYVAKRK